MLLFGILAVFSRLIYVCNGKTDALTNSFNPRVEEEREHNEPAIWNWFPRLVEAHWLIAAPRQNNWSELSLTSSVSVLTMWDIFNDKVIKWYFRRCFKNQNNQAHQLIAAPDKTEAEVELGLILTFCVGVTMWDICNEKVTVRYVKRWFKKEIDQSY